MSEEYDETQESGGALRAQLEQALADKKEAIAQVAELRATVRNMEVSSVLGTKGINPKVANFIPADVEGSEAISKWLDENADVFSATTVAPTEDVTPEPQAEEQPVDTASAQRLQSLSGSAGAGTVVADFESRIRDAKNNDEVQAILREAQEYVLAGS